MVRIIQQKEQASKTRSIICIISIIVICIIVPIIFWRGSTQKNAAPKNLYHSDPEIDMIIYKDTAYVNAAKLDWIQEEDLTEVTLLGTVERTAVEKGFRDFDATKVSIGTEIFSTAREDIIVIFLDGIPVPYYRYVEG